MPIELYPPAHVYSIAFDIRAIDPRFYAPEATLSPRRIRSADLESIFNPVQNPELRRSTELKEQSDCQSQHPSVSKRSQQKHSSSSSYLDKGISPEEQKCIIHQSSDEPPSSVVERLKDHDPAILHSYRQIKRTLETERRKRNRRQDSGPWTYKELKMFKQNTEKAPKDLDKITGQRGEFCEECGLSARYVGPAGAEGREGEHSFIK